MYNKSLFLKLYTAEREEEIEKIIEENHMNKDEYWQPYGGNYSNFSVIGNQASNAERALIEKFTNSVDAVFMRKVYENGIDPLSKQAPKSPREALEKLFNVKDGNTSNINKEIEKTISNNIFMMATNKNCESIAKGSKNYPNLIVYDNGEGQTPQNLPSTILSLLKGNKSAIPFTQGNYNQGGSGALMYCGNNGYCLVISKKHVNIHEKYRSKNDDTYNKWGWTLIRKEIRQGYKDPIYTYYAPNNMVPSFQCDELELLPEELDSKHSREYLEYEGSCRAYIPYKRKVKCGTAVKLYNYRVEKKGALNSHIKYDLAAYIYDTYLPIKFVDCRKNKSSNTYIFRGFKKIIEEDMRINTDAANGLVNRKLNFDFTIDNQKVITTIYCCNKRNSGDLTASKLVEGSRPIKFCLGQQFQGGLTGRFLNEAGLGTIQSLVIGIVEFPNISTEFKSDLFMTDRERLYDKRPKKEIQKKLKDYFKESEELREFRDYIMQNTIENEKKDNSSVKDVIEQWMDKDPSIKKILLGSTIPNNKANNKAKNGNDNGEIKPKNPKGRSKDKSLIETKFIPTYFNALLKTNEDGVYLKPSYVDSSFRIRFDTDASDDIFMRVDSTGDIKVFMDNKETKDYSKSIDNGICTIVFNQRVAGKRVQSKNLFVQLCINQQVLFENTIILMVNEREKQKVNNENDGDSGVLGLPNFISLKKENWTPDMNEETAVLLKNDFGKETYYINIDNKYLRDKMEELQDNKGLTEFYEQIYLYNMLFLAMSIKNNEVAALSNKNEEYSVVDEIESTTKAYSRVFFITEHLTNEMRKKLSI